MENKKNHLRHRLISNSSIVIFSESNIWPIPIPKIFGIGRSINIIIFLFSITYSYGQIFKKHINQYDDNGKRKGLWITYWDDKKKTPMSVARFKNGYEAGVSKEYHQNGNLRLKFRHYKNRIRVKYYNQDRKLESKGWSVIDYNEADTHYYWHGKWKFFDKNRKLTLVSHYLDGKEVTSE